jgi:transposase
MPLASTSEAQPILYPRRRIETMRRCAGFTALPSTFTLADWLKACGVDTVAMESTGVYWIRSFELLESRDTTRPLR